MSHSTFGNGGINLIPRICVGNIINNTAGRVEFFFLFSLPFNSIVNGYVFYAVKFDDTHKDQITSVTEFRQN